MASDKKTPTKTDLEKTPEVKSVFETAGQIVDAALAAPNANEIDQVDSAGEKGKDNDSVAKNFRGLPMRDLIGGPLIAAAEAQRNLAAVAWDFYQKIAFEQSGETTKTRLVEFTVDRPVQQDGALKMTSQQIKAPFIGLVPIPALLIDRVDIDFQMEVTDTNTEASSTRAEAASKVTGGWWVTKAEVSGKVTTSRENTRTTNQTAKYQVHVTASQQPQTEGLSKLMDIMASCIEPVPVSTK